MLCVGNRRVNFVSKHVLCGDMSHSGEVVRSLVEACRRMFAGALWRVDAVLVSGSRCGGSLSKQGVLHSWRPAATLFCYYDSLIEKCSTLSGPSVSSG
jgi:hypothetical protein